MLRTGSNITSEYINDGTLTTEESSIYNVILSDIATATRQKLSLFIAGDLDLSEWEAFNEQLYSLGLDMLREMLQVAYDRKHA